MNKLPPDTSEIKPSGLFGPPALSKGQMSRRLYDARPSMARTDAFLQRKVRAQFWAIKAGPPFSGLAALLVDCEPADAPHLVEEQNRPANGRRLDAIAYYLGFSHGDRQRLHKWAAHVELTDRFAGHILGRVKRGGQNQ
jgi:hypothetical protein